MQIEPKPYRFSDYLRAVLAAPLTSIPVAILIDLLVIYPTNRIVSSTMSNFDKFIRWAPFLILLSLSTAYVSTAFFGAIGVLYANAVRLRGSVLLGAIVGSVCGAITGFGWILFLTRELFEFRLLFTVFPGAVVIPISILSGLFTGIAFIKLIHRPQKTSGAAPDGTDESINDRQARAG